MLSPTVSGSVHSEVAHEFRPSGKKPPVLLAPPRVTTEMTCAGVRLKAMLLESASTCEGRGKQIRTSGPRYETGSK